MQPFQPSGHPQAALIEVHHVLPGGQVRFHLFIDRRDLFGGFYTALDHCPFGQRMLIQVGENLTGALQRNGVVVVEVAA